MKRTPLSPLVLLVMAIGMASCHTAAESAARADGVAAQLAAPSSRPAPLEPFDPNPFADRPQGEAGVANMHGTLSVENFQGQQTNLKLAHESADGFRNYLAQWYVPNYAYRDAQVGLWAHHDNASENYDRTTSNGIDVGIDSVVCAWHTSHGITWSNAVYQTWMGSNWANRGWAASSNKMCLGGNLGVFGNERLRYLWLDTCQSVRIYPTVDLSKVWQPRAKGLRMIFGYDTNSIDSAYYGTYFWQEWAKGKSFSLAFLDASWRIKHGQTPVAAAFGSTLADAVARRDYERAFYNTPVPAYQVAAVYYQATSLHTGAPVVTPGTAAPYRIAPAVGAEGAAATLARAVGVPVDTTALETRPFGHRVSRSAAGTLVLESDGDFEVTLAPGPAEPAGATLSDDEAVSRARALVTQHGLGSGSELRPSEVRKLMLAESRDALPLARTLVEKTVVMDQIVDGLPFVEADAGHVEISFDAATGALRRIRSTVRPVAATERPHAAALTVEDARKTALATVAAEIAVGGSSASLVVEAGSEAVGYQMRDGIAVPVYRVTLSDSRFPASRPTQIYVPVVAGL